MEEEVVEFEAVDEVWFGVVVEGDVAVDDGDEGEEACSCGLLSSTSCLGCFVSRSCCCSFSFCCLRS